ncbi:MAG: 5'/3'-nucleotidase SurE [Candidatus Caldarchaeum sp.]
MKRILLTNDDGITRPGLWALYDVLKEFGEVLVVAPESARSATGMSITLHKPLRMKRVSIHGTTAYACSGTPSDCVILAVNKLFAGKLPDLVVSGINEGNNVSLQAVYGSGTVAAAVRAALLGVPAAAFSLASKEEEPASFGWFRKAMRRAAGRAGPIVEWLLTNGMPEDVDYLSVNFPPEVNHQTPVKFTRAGRIRYREMVEERQDPQRRIYYWLHGKLIPESEFEPDTDVYALFVEKAVSVSPMRLDTSAPDVSRFRGLAELLSRARP